MPYMTPFHPRTQALCESYHWKEWAGYHAVCVFGDCHDREYQAIRHTAGLLDVTPLYKYDVRGRDAGQLLSWVMTREVTRLKVGRVVYCCWCDDDGMLLDDGTVSRLAKDHYRVTSSLPSYRWLDMNARGFEVVVEDTTQQIAVLALQGPNARSILNQVTDLATDLRFFGLASGEVAGLSTVLTRTGYTGDLGYELWVRNDDALALWDALCSAGKPWGIRPVGLDALDMARIEAGFVLQGVDYVSARDCLARWQMSSPFEAGLGWTVKLDREPFVGQAALRHEKERGSQWALVGLDVDWSETEGLFDRFGLPPQLSAGAWRATIPVYDAQQNIGRASSGTWSPLLKKNIALATVRSEYSGVDRELAIEMTAEYARHTVSARIVDMPFFDPPRKRA